MLSIMRRRVSSGGSSSLGNRSMVYGLGQSFRGVRPAISTPRIFTTSGDEVVHNSRGFGNVRNLCHLIFPGCSPSLRPIRSSLAPLLLRVKNIVCVEIKSCPKIFPIRSLHTIPMPRVSLLDYHKKHEENFFIIASTHPKTYIGPSPLCQQILRELISSAYQLKILNKPFVPNLSDIYLNFGDIGLVSITLDSCGPDSGNYIDPLVGYCTNVMCMLLKPNQLVELQDLEDVAIHSKWWGDLEDIFLHPFFMTPQMHQAFISNMNIIAYKANVAGDVDTMVKRQSLGKLATEFRKSWIWRATKRNKTWVDQCIFVVPEAWKQAHGGKMTLLRSVRNFLHHPCDDAQFFQTAAQWDHRLDHFILIMNSSHNISATLFHAFWRLKEQFETPVNPGTGTDMVMWKTALSSVLPIDQRISGVAVQSVQQPSV